MSEPFKPMPQGSPLVDSRGKCTGFIDVGGAELLMPIKGKTVLFEMHSYFGPIPLNKKTHKSLANDPPGFWKAYELWDLGGKMVDDTTCILPSWCPKCKGEGILKKRVGGRHWKMVGDCDKCEGKKVIHA